MYTEWNKQICNAANKEKEARGPSETQICIFTVESSHIARNKKFFAIVIHMSVLRKSSLRDYWSLRPIIQTPYAASVGMSRDRFLAVLTMLHLNNNDAKAARGESDYDPLFAHWLHYFRTSTYWKNSWLWTRQYAHFEAVYSFVFISKENPTNME